MTAQALFSSVSPRAMFHAPVGAFNPMIRGAQVTYAADEGALSVDAAVAALSELPPVEEPQAAEDAPAGDPEAEPEAAPPLDPESEAIPLAEDPLDPDAVIEGEEDAEPESDPETPAIAAPQSWDAAERAEFAKLSPVAQEIILKRETERDKAVSKAQQEATAVRKTAEADLAGLAQYKAQFDAIATRANQVFADKWSNVDWIAFARQDPAAYTIAKAEHDAELGELQRVQNAKVAADKVAEQAQQVEFQNYVSEQFTELSRIAPDLADPKDGPAKRTEVTQFLLGEGVPQDAIRQISAVEMSLARDAMLYRKLKAAGKTAAARPPTLATRPAPTPARAAAPSAAPPPRSSQQQTAQAAIARLDRTGSVEDGIAALRALRK